MAFPLGLLCFKRCGELMPVGVFLNKTSLQKACSLYLKSTNYVGLSDGVGTLVYNALGLGEAICLLPPQIFNIISQILSGGWELAAVAQLWGLGRSAREGLVARREPFNIWWLAGNSR